MILTEKAKKDFKEFLYNKYDVLYELKDYHKTMLYAEIIDWFDSVGIYITSDYFELNNGFYSEILNSDFEIIKPTRQEALTEAIKKANEIYNENIAYRNKQ